MIIKQSVVDVLMFLFERYLDDESGSVTDKRDSLQLSLEEIGFNNQEINQAFEWLEDLAELQSDSDEYISIKDSSTRIYSEEEKKLISVENIDFLTFLEQAQVLTPATRELILDRVIALGYPLDMEQLKWIIMIVLHSHPGVKTTLALVEDFIFDTAVDYIH
jgi:Smg protein